MISQHSGLLASLPLPQGFPPYVSVSARPWILSFNEHTPLLPRFLLLSLGERTSPLLPSPPHPDSAGSPAQGGPPGTEQHPSLPTLGLGKATPEKGASWGSDGGGKPRSSPESSPYVSTLLFLSLLINNCKSPGKRHLFPRPLPPSFLSPKGKHSQRGKLQQLNNHGNHTPNLSESQPPVLPRNSLIQAFHTLTGFITCLPPRRRILQLWFTLLSGSPILTLGSCPFWDFFFFFYRFLFI